MPARPSRRFTGDWRGSAGSVLFSPEQRTIHALNQTAADIWRCLEEGLAPEAIALEMARGGVARADADRFVAAALEQWRALDLFGPPPRR